MLMWALRGDFSICFGDQDRRQHRPLHHAVQRVDAAGNARHAFLHHAAEEGQQVAGAVVRVCFPGASARRGGFLYLATFEVHAEHRAGGGTDVQGRTLAKELEATRGWQVIPENKAGEDGTVMSAQLKGEAPDGQTLGFAITTTYDFAPMNSDNLSPEDFTYITTTAGSQMAVLARGGKPALTRYKMRRRVGTMASLVECRLTTGRTHQIRVHMANIGCPVVGDPLYGGGKRRLRGRGQDFCDIAAAIQSQALHAYLLGFRHPGTGKTLRFQSKLPCYFNILMERLDVV